ncbi:MAG TPA: hypothetical protein VHQ93_12995 [Chitinophagaceae bacterium]|nr:hypothetical protein [Chitinophagaceae bacterium]
MKLRSVIHGLIFISQTCFAQEVLRIQNGGIITIQPGVEFTLQGGLTLENGSGLANNGIVRLKNNAIANGSDWRDLSAGGAMIGTGKLIFNSNHQQYFSGLTDFYRVQINTAGLTLNDHFKISDQLELINGKINTGIYYAFLNKTNASSLLNDASNNGYSNSWINGNFRRSITSNADTYDFPVGNETRSNLLRLINNNVTGPNYLTASFGPKPGNDAGLNVFESGTKYIAVNNGGVWRLVPDVSASGGNFSLHLYFNSFTGLTDNQFGILRRPDASSNGIDWVVPAGSLLESYNGLGRKVSDGFARRINISDFSQWGIGMSSSIICKDCMTACTYSQGFYGNVNGVACFNNSGTSISSTQLMLNAFGATTSKVFGSVANLRFFTLYKTDITSKNIFKMLPGSGNSQAILVDNISPFSGAYYDDQSTWYLVPIQPNGSQKGRINNQLLSQLITLWFNIQTSSNLSAINLSNDTLVTVKQTACGSGVAAGDPVKFGLPHNVVTYLNGGHGYSNNVDGLYKLANDVLGGVNTVLSPLDVQLAIATINNAFDGCRILVGTIPYLQSEFLTKNSEKSIAINPEIISRQLSATAFPNPYSTKFSLVVTSPVTGTITIEFFSVNGSKIYKLQKFVLANRSSIIPYHGPYYRGVLVYKIKIDEYEASGTVIGPN